MPKRTQKAQGQVIVSKQLLQRMIDEEFSRAVLARRETVHEGLDTPAEEEAEGRSLTELQAELEAILHALVEHHGEGVAREAVDAAFDQALGSLPDADGD